MRHLLLPLFALSRLVACVEYEVAPEPKPVAPPDASVVPEAVTLDGVCVSEVRTLALQNRGGEALTLSAVELQGDGWSARHPSLPAVLAPGAVLDVTLTGTAGKATLTLVTDDPDQPELVVPLSANADIPPTVIITAPYEDEVIDPALPFQLKAVVADPETPVTELGAEWRSNRVGFLASATVDEGGRVVTEWPADTRWPGPHVFELVLTDGCGNLGENSIYACQDGAWAVESLVADVWRVEGEASVDQTAGTASIGPEVGAAFDAYLVFDSDLFDATFTVAGAGAGFTLTLLDSTRATEWLGGRGCGLGLGPEACAGKGLPGWSIVVDTLAGDGNDCAPPPSIALVADGELAAPLACASLVDFDAGPHAIEVHAADGALLVQLDGTAVLDAPVPPGTAFGAYAGFTGVGEWSFGELWLTDSRCK